MRYYQRALSLGAGRQNSDERKASNLQVGKRKSHLRIPFPVFGTTDTTDDLPVIHTVAHVLSPEKLSRLIVGNNANLM